MQLDAALTSDDVAAVETALANVDVYVFEQRQLVSVQWLSNELSIDAWLARAVLTRFVHDNRAAVDVTWFLSGFTTAINARVIRPHAPQAAAAAAQSGSTPDSSLDSSLTKDASDRSLHVVSVHEITLVHDDDLDAVKASFTDVHSLYPYSVTAKATDASPVKDLSSALHALQMTQLLAMYDEKDVMADNPLRDARFSSIESSALITRSRGRAAMTNGQGDGHAEEKEADGARASSGAMNAEPPSSSSALSTLKKGAARAKSALASMFSKQTTSMQDAIPSAEATPSSKSPQLLQTNALTVLPLAESTKSAKPKSGSALFGAQTARTGKRKGATQAEAGEEEATPMEDIGPEEEDEQAQDDSSPHAKANGSRAPAKKASSKSRKAAKAAPSKDKSLKGKKRKAKDAEDDDDEAFVYPNPYDSHSDEEEASNVEEEAAAAVDDAAAYNADDFVPSSSRDEDGGDDDVSKAHIKSFFTAAPAGASPSASLPALRKKKQVTRRDARGYLVTEMVDEADEDAEEQRKLKEADEEKERLAADARRKEAREKERREKEKAEDEERTRKEREKKDKREAKKEEKKAAAATKDAAAAPTATAGKKRKPAPDDEDVSVDETRHAGKAEGANGSDSGKDRERDGEGKESRKEVKVEEKDSKGKKGPGGKAAEVKPKNNSSILSFFSKR